MYLCGIGLQKKSAKLVSKGVYKVGGLVQTIENFLCYNTHSQSIWELLMLQTYLHTPVCYTSLYRRPYPRSIDPRRTVEDWCRSEGDSELLLHTYVCMLSRASTGSSCHLGTILK